MTVIHGLWSELSTDLGSGYPWTRVRVIHGLGIEFPSTSGRVIHGLGLGLSLD